MPTKTKAVKSTRPNTQLRGRADQRAMILEMLKRVEKAHTEDTTLRLPDGRETSLTYGYEIIEYIRAWVKASVKRTIAAPGGPR